MTRSSRRGPRGRAWGETYVRPKPPKESAPPHSAARRLSDYARDEACLLSGRRPPAWVAWPARLKVRIFTWASARLPVQGGYLPVPACAGDDLDLRLFFRIDSSAAAWRYRRVVVEHTYESIC